jgi:hypothetical protein
MVGRDWEKHRARRGVDGEIGAAGENMSACLGCVREVRVVTWMAAACGTVGILRLRRARGDADGEASLERRPLLAVFMMIMVEGRDRG